MRCHHSYVPLALVLSPLFALALSVAPAAAQDPEFAHSDEEQSILVLRELVMIETALLAGLENERAKALEALKSAADRLSGTSSSLMRALDTFALARAGAGERAEAVAALTDAETAHTIAQRNVETLSADTRQLAQRSADHDARLEGLQSRLRALEKEAPASRGVLSGSWELTVGPNGDSGTLVIRQFGTLVSGQYELASGRVGSMRGTFVRDTVQLEIIDARFGRDATFNGIYNEERGLSGTWEAARLGTGRPAFGDWRATRPAAARPEQR